MNNLKDVLESTVSRIQSPETVFGKSARDGIIVGLSWIMIVFLENLDQIDFGNYDAIVATIIGGLIASLNRKTRTVKREPE